MRESEIINSSDQPVTRQSLVFDLDKLGITAGMTVLVHSSLSSLGWVCGGPHAVVLALQDAVGSAGTLVMPSHSSALSDPAQWVNPPVPQHWWNEIREQMPAFDPDSTPTRAMGQVAELFRTMPGVIRSSHPQHSFSAIGPNAKTITANHELNFGLGESSPLARIYELGGYVLLLGVGYESNTSLHLAEYRANPNAINMIEEGAPVMEQGKRTWLTINNLDLDSDDFDRIGQAFEQQVDLAKSDTYRQSAVRTGTVGSATSKLISQPKLIDFATQWMLQNR